MRHEFVYPSKPVPGDRIAVLSPSGRGPANFPAAYQLGLHRLEHQFGLRPVEFPTTRAAVASPAARAADIHAAFLDPSIKAVIASAGGEEQLKVLAHLDPEVFRASPKPFFGYSDNTNLLQFLWTHGVVGYHGGMVMLQFARAGQMDAMTATSLHRALFSRGEFELSQAREFSDRDVDWGQAGDGPAPIMTPAASWEWHGPKKCVEGPTWGGSLEVTDMQLQTSRYLGHRDSYEGAVVFIETSGELPTASYVYRVLMCMGERGMLHRAAAILVGRTKAWSSERPNPAEVRRRYAEEQRDAVLRAVSEYIPDAVVVFNVDIGHTEPQLVMPMGGTVRVDGVTQRITVTY